MVDDYTGRENEGADDVPAQLDNGEILEDRGLDDWLDEGYSPPDREPSVDVPTEAEEQQGASLDKLLAAEEPDVGVGDSENLFAEYGDEVGDRRAGRLVNGDGSAYGDTDSDLWAGDVGIDGAGASAEEAAVHVLNPDGEEDGED
jgi:hypothetical protein